MFFDCTGLLAGLAASVITKWKANDKYSYGYVRAEVIAGFVNGLFLLFISFFIMSEAVERAIEPPEVSYHEMCLLLFILSHFKNYFIHLFKLFGTVFICLLIFVSVLYLT